MLLISLSVNENDGHLTEKKIMESDVSKTVIYEGVKKSVQHET